MGHSKCLSVPRDNDIRRIDSSSSISSDPLPVKDIEVFVFNPILYRNITISVNPRCSVRTLKQKVADKEGIAIAAFDLYFDGIDGVHKPVNRFESTLLDYDIQHHSTLRMHINIHAVCGQKALNYARYFAEKKSCDVTRAKLEKRLKKIAKSNSIPTNSVYDTVTEFLQADVPIIIHVHCAKMIPILLKDSYYRNLFETGTGSGSTSKSTRAQYEAQLFKNAYRRAHASERPKYGCLNIGLQPEGVHHARRYGDGYFVLNDETVRWRTTITVRDSFHANGNVGTLNRCEHLLCELNDGELTELAKTAAFCEKGGRRQRTYREVQIHGPIKLDRDIVSFHVPRNAKNTKMKNMFEQFCENNNCELVWF